MHTRLCAPLWSFGRGILLKLWQRGIHCIPRVRVGCPHLDLRIEPTRIIQAGSSDRDNLRDRVGLDRNGTAAFRAEAASGHSARFAGRGMETERPLQKLKGIRRHDDKRGKRASAGSLAITTVAVKHHDRFCRGFVANRAASASA